ncbi:MAG: hypothetical protein MHM6MM_002368 [Cercozoa sp. M6MM]
MQARKRLVSLCARQSRFGAAAWRPSHQVPPPAVLATAVMPYEGPRSKSEILMGAVGDSYNEMMREVRSSPLMQKVSQRLGGAQERMQATTETWDQTQNPLLVSMRNAADSVSDENESGSAYSTIYALADYNEAELLDDVHEWSEEILYRYLWARDPQWVKKNCDARGQAYFDVWRHVFAARCGVADEASAAAAAAAQARAQGNEEAAEEEDLKMQAAQARVAELAESLRFVGHVFHTDRPVIEQAEKDEHGIPTVRMRFAAQVDMRVEDEQGNSVYGLSANSLDYPSVENGQCLVELRFVPDATGPVNELDEDDVDEHPDHERFTESEEFYPGRPETLDHRWRIGIVEYHDVGLLAGASADTSNQDF